MQDIGDRQFHVIHVDDCELPEGVDFAFLEFDDEVWLAYKRTKLTPPVQESAWRTYLRSA